LSVTARLNIKQVEHQEKVVQKRESVKTTSSRWSEQDLIAGCKKGKRKYQTQLYKQYCDAMLGVAMRYCDNQTEAEDALQEAFLKIFKSMKSFEGQRGGSLTAWIKTIVVNTALSTNRKNKKHNFTDDVEDYKVADEASVVFFMSEEQQMKDRQRQILHAVQSLPSGYRTVFNLYVMEGYSHAEIAEILEVSENTSKSQLSKARRMLKSKLGYLKDRGE